MSSSLEQQELFDYRERLVGRRDDADPVIRLEIYGILIMAFSVCLTLALLTFSPADVTSLGGTRYQPAQNLIGPIGAHLADLVLATFGLVSFLLAPLLGLLGLTYLFGRRWRIQRADILGWMGMMIASAVVIHVALSPAQFLGHVPGGFVGSYVGEVGRALLSTIGTLILALAVFVVSIVAVTRRSIFELAVLAFRRLKSLHKNIRDASGQLDIAVGRNQAEPIFEVDADDIVVSRELTDSDLRVEVIVPPPLPKALQPVVAPELQELDVEDPPSGSESSALATEPSQSPDPATPSASPSGRRNTPTSEGLQIHERSDLNTHLSEEATASAATPIDDAQDEETTSQGVIAYTPPEPGRSGEEDAGPSIVESEAMQQPLILEDVEGPAISEPPETPQWPAEFELPTMSLLDYKAPVGRTYDRDVLRENAMRLEAKLADYRVQGKVVEIHPGPVITMYEFKPASGVKISKIAALSDDLAMALSAMSIRIVAPIPGKDVVGIEVPNSSREIVWMKEILSDDSFTKSKSKKMTLALGKDIVGTPTCMNLSKAPHLLVAGATGAGKSVAINSFICSLLYQATPAEVRLIMIDPKILELSIYDGIPHLMLPVVTDPKNASIALKWAVKEMDRRYHLMADLGVRNLENFNAKVSTILESEDPLAAVPEKLKDARLRRERAGNPDPTGDVLDTYGQPLEHLPKIVIIVDELADLMMVAKKDVELSIARLAQKARASGIHLILATQRPSVDVITGLIKANFPSRISFRVSSKIDSRTILDQQGAEALLGMGDMLWLAPGGAGPKRVHGCFIDEDEVHRIVGHLKTQGEPQYQLDILADDEEGEVDLPSGGEHCDPLYDQALRIVAETRNASISFLQRKLKVGYNRAARIVEELEEQGIIGPSDGTSRPRDVFIDPI